MKNKVISLAIAICLFAAAPLMASEAVWEVQVAAALPATSFVLPDPLPEPAPIPFLDQATLSAAAPQPTVPIRIPGIRPAARSGKAFFDANLALLIGLNVADYVTTREAFKYPGLEETNPLMKPFVKSPAAFAAIKIGTTALSYWSMRAIFKKNKTVAWVMTTASNVLLSYVVANNIRMIEGARAR